MAKHNFRLKHLLLYLYVFYGPNLAKILFQPHENNYIQQIITGLLFTTETLTNTALVNLDQSQKDNLVLNFNQALPRRNITKVKRELPLLLKKL